MRHAESKVLLSETKGLQFVPAQVAATFGREGVDGEVDEVEGEPGTEQNDSHEWLGPIGRVELENIVGRMQASTATGLYGFPPSLLKNLGPM